MTERFSVAAVVVTYNRLPLLRQCLAALAAQTALDLPIFLGDNASTDGIAESVAEMALPNLVYRNTGKNLGGAGGFAYGVREAALAGYDALWLMDDDTLPTPTALEAFLQADRNLQGQYGWHRLEFHFVLTASVRHPQHLFIGFRESKLYMINNLYHPATIPSIVHHTIAHDIQTILQDDQIIRADLIQCLATGDIQSLQYHTRVSPKREIIAHDT